VVIVAVERGAEILLGRSPHFPPGLYSTLAGFVDAGESAEQAVHREIFEETGLYIRAPRYFSSQAWPFPHALMLGYQAEYAGGDIVCAPGEIEDARFFHVDALPPLFPIRYAMANQLLRDFCLRHGRSWPPAQAAPIAA
jgi:NAD+ diphosphatase